MPGVRAVVLGGSRSAALADERSDWDLGVYYRSAIDLGKLTAHGTVHPPGSWGRLMNGGAWLERGGAKVDVLLRDLDVVEHWTRRAEEGYFEVDALLGYAAGAPTYLLTAELASSRVLRGDLARVAFPPKLAASAPARWRYHRTFSLDYARMHARRCSVIGVVSQATKAVLEEAHAVACERSMWVINEKRLIEMAGLERLHERFRQVPNDARALGMWVEEIAAELGWAYDRQPKPE